MLPKSAGECNSLEDVALHFHDMGLSVIPTCEKKALVKWKQLQHEPLDAEELRKQFRGPSNGLGLGVICGEASRGLIVRDFDDPACYERWKAAHPIEGVTLPTVKTNRGYHVWARVAGKVPSRKFKGLGELRAEGNYVVAPPSLGSAGRPLEWIVPITGEIPLVDLATCEFEQPWGPATPTSLASATEAVYRLLSNSVALAPDCSVAHSEDCSVARRLQESDEVLRAIRDTLPNGIGQRNNALFDLARKLRGIPSVACGDFAEVKAIVKLWHSEAVSVIGTKDFEQSWHEFCAAWRSVKYPDSNSPADDPIAEACGRGNMLDVEHFFSGRRSEQRVWLAAVCWQLQLRAAPQPFFLSATTAARIMAMPEGNVSRAIANRHVRALCDMGLLEVALRPPRLSGLAYRYRFPAAIENLKRDHQSAA